MKSVSKFGFCKTIKQKGYSKTRKVKVKINGKELEFIIRSDQEVQESRNKAYKLLVP